METNIQEVIASLSRQIADLSLKLALAEATIASYKSEDSTEEQD